MKTAADLYATGQAPGGAALADWHWLRAHRDDPQVRVVEVDVSPAAYNGRLIGALMSWAFASLNASPEHAPSTTISVPKDTTTATRFAGSLTASSASCTDALKTRTRYDEATAWSHRENLPQSSAAA